MRTNVAITDHCVDALRESIQCSGDLTPIPIILPYEGIRQIPDTAQVHTCRNFDVLKDLVYVRNTSDFMNKI
jgi:Mycotoxin biosynthesis protein UstYa